MIVSSSCNDVYMETSSEQSPTLRSSMLLRMLVLQIAFISSLFSSAICSTTSELTTDAKSLIGKKFDYIIVGAGNAGLVVANRLSEDPRINVLVIEGGGDTRKDINVFKADEQYAFNQKSPIHSYNYYTTPQIGGEMKLEWYGRGLGGSTTVNGQVWNAPSRQQLNQLEALGNKGWSFDDLLPYYIKAQDYHPPSKKLQREFGVTFDSAVHRKGGPATISHPNITFSGPPQQAFVKAVKSALTIKPAKDLQSGVNDGVAFVAQTLYPNTNLTRMSSATAYYSPIEGKRPNLTILLKTRAIKIVWKKRKGSKKLKAVGVVVQHSPDGEKLTMRASREVILSAGSIRSPQLLELSGVGDKTILSEIKVPQKINLPGVGRNLAEQCQVGINAPNKNRSWRGIGASSSIAQPKANQIFANVTEVQRYVKMHLKEWAQEQVDAGAATHQKAVLRQYKLIYNSIFKGKTPTTELFFGNGFLADNSGLSISVYTLTPLSRGFTHANSSDPWASPVVNPRFWTVPFDMDVEVASLSAAKKIFATREMLSVMNGTRSSPDCNCTRDSIEEYAYFRKYIISSFGILDHAVGTCSMLPRSDGGVVDAKLKVYGTSNVRVIDASILPMQLSAHPQATIYALAEKGADLIKAAAKRH